ncbi:MAG: inositol monophosphatase family protein, partial [Acetobacteraceae bacterium]
MTSANSHPGRAAGLLAPVAEAVREAGEMLAAEFCRPAGPRGSGDKAPVDVEIEQFLRTRLTALLATRFVGEEDGAGGELADGLCWVVDPNDGTRDFLQGHRGSAISVALLDDGRPVLGVVYAPLPPDRGPDLIAWADGAESLTRNGVAVPAHLADRSLAAGSFVLLSVGARLRPADYARLVAPARFIALPSIAYRLARVAAGDGVATASWNTLSPYDIAGGHALVAAAGGVMRDQQGAPVRYAANGEGRIDRLFAGAPAAANLLRARERILGPRRTPRVALGFPRENPHTDRAIGCLLGQVIGDSLGSLVEFRTRDEIRARHPAGVRDLADGGTWNILAGQPTDDSELALALAHALVAQHGYDDEAVAAAYARWYQSAPFDCGSTIARAVAAAASAPEERRAKTARAKANRSRQSNGALMRASPIGIAARTRDKTADWATRDCLLTHPHPTCVAASVAFTAAISAGIAGATPHQMSESALRAAARSPGGEAASGRLAEAAAGRGPEDFKTHQGWVLTALQNAFRHLLSTRSPEQALMETVGEGGDSDTNAAIAGALLGAAFGRDAWPSRWVLPVLSCRPLAEFGAAHPRPEEYWPDDVPMLAEALL